MPAPTPPVLPQAFGTNAPIGTINVIPNTTGTPGRASYDLGFPGLTMEPIIAGGIPPLGQDVNGVLFAISSHSFYVQSGKPYLYNSTVSTAIGGYAVGTLLGMSDGSGVWINQLAANTNDPDAGGAGWVPSFSYGLTSVSTTGGTTTLTAAQTRRNVIVVSGALVSNATLNFPMTLQRWLIVNATSGAFTLTVKTASGTGAVIPPGGYGAPLEVYGDGTNLYPAVSPVTLPTSVAPTANSIVLRDASGNIYGAYLNQSSALENLAISSLMFQTGTDGWLRKMSLVNVQAQMLLQSIGGAVVAAQVPQAAVTQYAAAILASAALTGVPTAPTAAAGTNTTQVASTAFVQAAGLGGSSQSWVDFSGVKTLGSVYTNTTGATIFVSVSVNLNSGGSVYGYVNGAGPLAAIAASGGNQQMCIGLPVPPGATYLFNINTGIASASSWAELR